MVRKLDRTSAKDGSPEVLSDSDKDELLEFILTMRVMLKLWRVEEALVGKTKDIADH